MAAIDRFQDIKAWQKARELVREVYQVCGATRLGRDFGLRDQICRAAVSTMSNIAEGFSRKSDKEFARYLDIARGSCGEVQSLLYVTLDVAYVSQEDFDRLYELASAAASLISGFTSYLRNRRPPAGPSTDPAD
ncbi:MAG TPA: four helix bundle protein [Gemmataceae bacterium]|nr:four helix bundle protein [Gemmataceae bacterium]